MTYDLDDFSEIPQSDLDKADASEFAKAKKEADHKTAKVMQFIEANPSSTMRQVAEKFNLAWSLEREGPNGIGRINFYTDTSQRFFVCDTHDEVSKWFRQ